MKKSLFILLSLLLLPLSLQSAVPAFAPIFNRGAVLQCEMPANVWGTANPGAEISIRLDGAQVVTARTASDGRWQAAIPAQEPGGPRLLEAHDGKTSAKVEDVWFGEVWVASGQSNMVQNLRGSEGGPEALAKPIADIRFVSVPRTTGLPPAGKLTTKELAWKEFAPAANAKLAAVAFFFADRIREETGRRVGILHAAVGGTPAQSWTPLTALESDPSLAAWAQQARRATALAMTPEQLEEAMEGRKKAHLQAMAEWEKDKTQPRPLPLSPPPGNPFSASTATVLWENMITPFVPYTARGVIWYQGEANTSDPTKYRTLFPALIAGWRKAWGRPDLPFFFVQLASLESARGKPASGDWPGLRAAQAYTRDSVPGTGMAVAIDSGERDNIHPKFKKPVGERLARLALAQVYGRDHAARGPLMTKASHEGGKITATFDHAGTGLQTANGQPGIPGVEVAASDGKFHAATARIIGPATIELVAAEVPSPTTIRYAWSAWIEPPVTLQNSDGLPAEPAEIRLP